jgi:hypothetical protein
MRSAIFVFFLLLLMASCSTDNSQKQESMPEEMKSQALDLGGYKKHSVLLINQLGSVSLYLPIAMDTFYTYADFGEYRCGETKQFRFSQKKFSPAHETDFSYSDPADSLYQLTITQTYNTDCETYLTIDDVLLHSLQKDKSHTYTMMDTKGKKIIVGVHQAKIDSMEVVEIIAKTTVSGRPVNFIFQCFKKSADGFLNLMLTSLKTIEIKEDTTGHS